MRKVLLTAVLTAAIGANAVSFGTASKDVQKTINVDGKDFRYVIGTASKDGKYFTAGNRICNGVAQCVAADTDGSKQNMELLADGQINGALVQADAFNTFIENNPQYKDSLLAASLDATEQIQIVMLKGKTEDDLQSKNATIYVGPLKSGGAASWAAMSKLEPGYAKASVLTDTFGSTSSIALNKLKSGEYTAIIRTSMASADDKFVKQINEDKELKFVNVNDKDLDDSILVNGKNAPLYKFVKMTTEKGFISSSSVEVPETQVLFVFNKNLYSTAQLNEMLDNINLKKSGLFK